MTSFLFTTLPSNDLGLLTRSLPVASALAQKGHRITYSSPARAPSRLISEAGFENRPPKHPLFHFVSGTPSLGRLRRIVRAPGFQQDYGSVPRFVCELVKAIPLRFAPMTAEVWDGNHAAAMAGMMNANFVRATLGAMIRLIRDVDPDVVVDFWNPLACAAARVLHKPLVAVMQADQHPANPGFIWWREPPPDRPTAVPAVNTVLLEHGLPPVGRIEELTVGELTLMLGMPETDPVPAAASVTYVGAILWQAPGASLPDWTEQLSCETPVIWIYMGNLRYGRRESPLDSRVVLDACVSALAHEDVQVVLTTGHHALPPEVPPLPANFRHERYVPGLAMADRCDLMIHHGGYGSCQTGLYTGTPAVIIPTFSERESNARRVAAAGAGAFLLPTADASGSKRLDPARLRETVRRVLADPAFLANAQRLGRDLRRYGGASVAATLIEEMASSRVSATPPPE